MKKKYKQVFRPKGGFFSSADEIIDKNSNPNSVNDKNQSSTNYKSDTYQLKTNPQIDKTKNINSKNPNSNQDNKSFNKSSKNIYSKRPNFAFIDGQNLNKSIQNQGWSLDYKEFRNYLDQKYGVKKAYMFIGMVNTNQQLYSALQDFGYHLVFKPTLATKQGELKGNVDAEMVLYALTQINQYDQAVIVSGDGDFYTLVQYLKSQGKLKSLLVPNEKAYSNLYDTLDIKTDFVDDLRQKLEYKKK
jgi:uncharacterized LabA/DUF88 family protein